MQVKSLELRFHSPIDTNIFIPSLGIKERFDKQFEPVKRIFEQATGHELHKAGISTIESDQGYEVEGEIGLYEIQLNKFVSDFEVELEGFTTKIEIEKMSIVIYMTGSAIFRLKAKVSDNRLHNGKELNKLLKKIYSGDSPLFDSIFSDECQRSLIALESLLPTIKEDNFFVNNNRQRYFYWTHTYIILITEGAVNDSDVKDYYIQAAQDFNDAEYHNISRYDQFQLFTGVGVSICAHPGGEQFEDYVRTTTRAQEVEEMIWKCLWNANTFLRNKLKLLNSYLYDKKSLSVIKKEVGNLKKVSLQIEIFIDDFKSSNLSASYPMIAYMESIRNNWKTDQIQTDVIDKLNLVGENLNQFNEEERNRMQRAIELLLVFITLFSTLSVIWDTLSLFSLEAMNRIYKVLVIVVLWTSLLIAYKWLLPKLRKHE
jgi:hypothetical protein